MNHPLTINDQPVTKDQEILITDRALAFARLCHLPAYQEDTKLTRELFLKCALMDGITDIELSEAIGTLFGYYAGTGFPMAFLMDHLNLHLSCFVLAMEEIHYGESY